MPILLFIIGAATLALVAAQGSKGGPARSYTIDSAMPVPMRDQVLAALASERNPSNLEAFAQGIGATYPLAGAALRSRAAELRATGSPGYGPTPTVPTLPVVNPPSPGPAPNHPVQANALDILNVPEPGRTAVLSALMTGTDRALLEGYAAQVAPVAPMTAAALRARASMLGALSTAPPAPAPSPVPTPPVTPVQPSPPAPAPTPPAPVPEPVQPAPPAPTPSPGQTPPVTPPVPPSPIPLPPVPTIPAGYDAGMPAEVAQAVTNALTSENDPAKLRGFASSLQPKYPLSAGLLTAKASALELLRPPTPKTTPVLPPSPTPVQPKPTPAIPGPPAPPIPGGGQITDARLYTVKNGDSPWKIAERFTGNGTRWKELVAENSPPKKKAADGNFASLLPGELLRIPASWDALVLAKSKPKGAVRAPA